MYDDCRIMKGEGSVFDMPLGALLGPDGLMYLLALIDAGSVATDEVLDMIKRLHIPGYEQARRYFDRAIDKELIRPELWPGYFCYQKEIDTVLSHNWNEGVLIECSNDESRAAA